MINREELLGEYWRFLDLCEDHFTSGYAKIHPSPPSFPKPRPVSPRETRLLELYHQMDECQECLYRYNRGHGKIAEGPISPELCIVTIAPDVEAVQNESVFSKEAGEYLGKWLDAIQVNLDDTYRTFILKCRPPQKDSNHWTESNVCLDYFKKQIKLVGPEIILALGEPAIQLLTDEKDKSLREMEGGIYSFMGIPLFCTYHPRDVLKELRLKSAVWQDLKHLRSFMDQNKK